jgi:sugar phosphate permease
LGCYTIEEEEEEEKEQEQEQEKEEETMSVLCIFVTFSTFHFLLD